MTTTLPRINNRASDILKFTGTKSGGFKLISILFVFLLNTGGLSSQTEIHSDNTLAYAALNTSHKVRFATVPVKPISYTVFQAQRFPMIEGPADQFLLAMDDHEQVDYEALFVNPVSKSNVYGVKSAKSEVSRSLKGNLKNKIAPKLNS